MRRHDKKKHIEKVNILFEQRCISEQIKPEEAYRDIDAMMTVLKGKRDVCFLVGPFVEDHYEKYIKNHPTAKLLKVERDGEGQYGDAYILHTNIEKAQNLKTLMDSQGGYLTTDTPELIIANGEGLEYFDADIKSFVDGRYGEGTYNKTKGKL